jgi:Holliday junction resolvase RusA-like endonuclease
VTLQVSFAVPGAPRGKGRPRFTRKGFAYTDQATRIYERAVATLAEAVMAGRDPSEAPCSVRISVIHGIPKSWPAKRRDAALAGALLPGKPDMDNVAKGVLDAMNGVIYDDDKQVIRLVVEKKYGVFPRVEVEVTEVLP